MDVLVTRKLSNGINSAVPVVKAGGKLIAKDDELFTVTVSVNVAGKLTAKKIEQIKAVAVGYSHVIVLTKENHVYGIGNNFKGQLGMGEQLNFLEWIYLGIEAKDIAAGYVHSALVTDDNKLYVTGCNKKNQIMLGDVVEAKRWTYVSDNITNVTAESYATKIKEIA